MTNRARVSLAGLIGICVVLAWLCACSATARAESPWGALAGSGFRLKSGIGAGEVKLKPEESSISVDPAGGGFFAAYKPDEGNHEPLRLAHFSASGAEGPKVEFKVPNEESLGKGGELGKGVETAFDPANHRVYVLVRWQRYEQNNKETSPAPEGTVAGALYAFEYTGAALVSLALKEEKKEKVPAPILDKEGFKGQGEGAKEPLLHPLGLAVDPTTGNVAILGEQDESSATQIKNEEEVCRAALQWVTIEPGAELHGKLAARYVDKANVLGKHFTEGKAGHESEECGEEEEASEWQAYSPVFTPGGALLAMSTQPGEEQAAIWELPAAYKASGEASTTPKLAYTRPAEVGIEMETGAEEATEATVPTMSLVKDAAGEGKLYVSARYYPESQIAPSVLVLHYAEEAGGTKLTEFGWVGGHHHFLQKAETSEEIASATCSLPEAAAGGVVGIPQSLALVGGYKGAGGEGVMAFKTGYQNMLVGIDLGPGGDSARCLKTELESPTVIYAGKPNPFSVPTGATVTLTSNLVAGAVSAVEWNFGDGTAVVKQPNGSEPLPGDLTETSVKHAFQHPGQYTVTEKVKASANLAGPSELTQTRSVLVSSSLIIQLGEPSPVQLGEVAHLAAIVHVPGGKSGEPVKYEWAFGDGATSGAKTQALNAKDEAVLSEDHTYSSTCGGRCQITLRVLESPEGEGSEETSIEVRSGSTGGGGGGGGGGGTTTGGGSGGGSSPPPAEGEVKGATTVHVSPAASLAGTSLSVSPNGAVKLKVTCPAGASSCTGTVTLRTLSAVSAAKHKGKKKAILTLAHGSFSVAGGQAKAITLHLTSKGRALLAHSHVLRALATLVAHDASGASHTTTAHATLRLVHKGKKKH